MDVMSPTNDDYGTMTCWQDDDTGGELGVDSDFCFPIFATCRSPPRDDPTLPTTCENILVQSDGTEFLINYVPTTDPILSYSESCEDESCMGDA